jgi:5-methylcytosine-specific restriction endonuclease McrA
MEYGKVFQRNRILALKRDNNICRRCGKPAKNVHHVIPRKKLENDSIENLVTLCKKCHRQVDNRFILVGQTAYTRRWINENMKKKSQ